jgi:hypothetical protein
MKKLWTAGLLLTLGGVLPGARAGEVVATALSRSPVATVKGPATSPAATIGRPVVVSRYREVPPVLPVAYEERSTAEAASGPPESVPAKPGPLAILPNLPAVPVSGGVRTADAVDAETRFAVERVAWIEPKTEPLPAPTATSTPASAPTPTVGGLDATWAGPAPSLDMGEAPPPARFFVSGEYLLWWTKDDTTPPLVTTSLIAPDPTATVVPQPGSGFLGDPNTRVLFGGDIDRGVQSGFRLRAGYWLDTDLPIGIEGGFFFLGRDSETFSVNSDGLPTQTIARPFFALNRVPPVAGVTFNLPGQFSEIVAAPLLARGGMVIDSPSSLNGFDLNAACPLWCYNSCAGAARVNLLGGFRYLSLREGLYITEAGTIDPFAIAANATNGVPPGDNSVAFRIDDRFDTANRFYGGQAGVAGRWTTGRWSVDFRGTLGLGVVRQVATINGSAIFNNLDGSTDRFQGGLLALRTNIGRFTQSKFGVLPEIGVNVGYQLTDTLRVFGGYNFLWLNSVLRPGDVIDPVIDIVNVPRFGQNLRPIPSGINRPAPNLDDSSFWAQGISLGLEWRY